MEGSCLFYEIQVLVHRRSTQPTHPCQLADVELVCSVCRVMAVERGRDVLLRGLRSADAFALGFGVRHAGFHPRTDHRQFQLRKDCAHLDERLAHRINLPVPAIHRDASDDNQTQVLLLDGFDDAA